MRTIFPTKNFYYQDVRPSPQEKPKKKIIEKSYSIHQFTYTSESNIIIKNEARVLSLNV